MMSTQTVRPSAVAGLFYPGEAVALAEEVDRLLAGAPILIGPPKALIVPHAGYVYSGQVAASAFAQLRPVRERIKRVVILGPNHRVPLTGIAMPSSSGFTTPLGEVPVDGQAMALIGDLPGCAVHDEAHKDEHGLEVMLPFLQRQLDAFTLVPLIVGQTPPDRLRTLLDLLWGGPETLFVISSDLSHYLTGDAARRADLQTAHILEKLNPEQMGTAQACGVHPLTGFLDQAASRDLRITRLDLCHSGDTAGSDDKVVGYGAWGFEYAHQAHIRPMDREALHALARRAVVRGAETGAAPDLSRLPVTLHTLRASFTTITVDGRFRGCRGTIDPIRSVAEDVARNAQLSAFEDPRVPPLSAAEAGRAEIGISILSRPRPIECSSEADLRDQLSPDRDGLILAGQQRRALFLPKVWQDLPHAQDFVTALKHKGGWERDAWPEDMRAWRFSAEYF